MSRSPLAIAAALLGTAIASAAHGGGFSPLTCTTLTSAYVNMVSATPELSFAFSYSTGTPSAYLHWNTFTTVASASGVILAYSAAGEERLTMTYKTGQAPGFLPIGLSSGTIGWVVSFTNSVTLSTRVSDLAGTWTADAGSGPSAIALGQTFAAGTYTFGWTLDTATLLAPDGASYDFDLGFTPVPVPLPGAAGLAALGLLGGLRRRRR